MDFCHVLREHCKDAHEEKSLLSGSGGGGGGGMCRVCSSCSFSDRFRGFQESITLAAPKPNRSPLTSRRVLTDRSGKST